MVTQKPKRSKPASVGGVQLSGSVKPVSFMTLYVQGQYGEGIARYISDLAVLNVDLLPDSNEAGVMKTIPMCGISCGLRVDFSKKSMQQPITPLPSSIGKKAILPAAITAGENIFPVLYSGTLFKI